MQTDLNADDLTEIRTIVSQLDTDAILALERSGFVMVRAGDIPRPTPTAALRQLLARGVSKGFD